jgi:integrase
MQANVIELPVASVTMGNGGRDTKKIGLISTDPWKFKFKFEGKAYSLVKRNQTRDGNWWLDVTIKGARISKSLETNAGDAAAQRAMDLYIKPAKEGRLVQEQKPVDYATVDEVLAAYEAMSVGAIDKDTVRANKNAFRLVVRRGLGDEGMADEVVDAQRATVLDGKLVSGFEAFMQQQAVAVGKNKESNKRTVIAYLRQARSVFKEINMPKFKERGLRLPDVKDFMKRKTERAARLVHMPPSDELLLKTFAAAKVLKNEDRSAYVAWLLGCSTLRRKEIRWMKFDWVQRMGGAPVVIVPAEFGGTMVKSKCERPVPVDEHVVRELEQWQKLRAADGRDVEYVIPSPGVNGARAVKDRGEKVFRRVDDWMRELGWVGQHTLHEMRAYTLQIVRDEYGLSTASAVAGHEDEKTTKNHYVGAAGVRGVKVSLPMFGKKPKKDEGGTVAALMEVIKGLQAELAALRADRAAGS